MNIAFVYEDRIITAPIGDTILDGVTRDSVGHPLRRLRLQLGGGAAGHRRDLRRRRRAASSRRPSPAAPRRWSRPSASIHFGGKDHQVGDGKEGPITRRLRETLCEIHTGSSALHPEWIHNGARVRVGVRMENLKLERPLVCFDLETTGTSIDRDRIVEIGLVRVEPDGSRRTFRTLVNPEMPIPPAASAVHGITDADVRDAPLLAAVAREILALFDGADLAGFNSVGFDAPLLEADLRRVGTTLDLAGRRHLDAMRIFHPMEPRTLTAAYRKYCGKDLVDAHAALADVEATLEVLDAMVARYEELRGDVDDLHGFCNPDEGRCVDRGRASSSGTTTATRSSPSASTRASPSRRSPGRSPTTWSGCWATDFSDEVRTILSDALRRRFPTKPAAAGAGDAADPADAPAGPLTLFPDGGMIP